MGRVVKIPDVFVGDYDPLDFLQLVHSELGDRPTLVSTIVVALSADGHLTIHTSSSDRERNLGLLALAERHTLDEFGHAITKGFSRDVTVTREGD